MRTLILSSVLALGVGVVAAGSASAGPVRVVGPWSHGGSDNCRTVEKRQTKAGRTVITRERECGDRYSSRDQDRYERDRHDRYADRRDYRDRDERSGVNLNFGR